MSNSMNEGSRRTEAWRLAKMRGAVFSIDPTVTHRKINSLNAAGHTKAAIAAQMGVTPQAVDNIMKRAVLRPSTVKAVAAAYRAMEMRIPSDTRESRKTRNRALGANMLPPLAWEDIDAGVVAEQDYNALWYLNKELGLPTRKPLGFQRPPDDRFDLDIIQDVIDHNTWKQVPTSRLEKLEIMRRWIAGGRTEEELCKLTGWDRGRYHQPQEVPP